MPQALLPIIPAGATPINDVMSVFRGEGRWTYFCGFNPVFEHPEGDGRSFRMFTAQLVSRGQCRVTEIVRTFGVSKNSVLRSVAKYRQEKVEGFFHPRRGRGATVMTAEVTAQAEALLAQGHTRCEAAESLGVKPDTLRKAIEQGRVREPSDSVSPPAAVATEPVSPSPAAIPSPMRETDKSTRSDADAAAGDEMGVACTRPVERVLASLGQLPEGASTRDSSLVAT